MCVEDSRIIGVGDQDTTPPTAATGPVPAAIPATAADQGADPGCYTSRGRLSLSN